MIKDIKDWKTYHKINEVAVVEETLLNKFPDILKNDILAYR